MIRNMPAREVFVGSHPIGNDRPLTLIAGPCVIENESFALQTAETLCQIADRVGMPLLYKSSFDKANRSSQSSFRGVGVEEGLEILAKVKQKTNLAVVTDLHEPWQAQQVAAVVDLLQTPAFLCRQTDFIQAVARAGRPMNIKKGQFLAPNDMLLVAQKAQAVGNEQILLCERGTTFGYRDLVVDMRGLEIMARSGFPVVFDATHSVQQPGGLGGSSGGQREFVLPLARAAVAVGIAAIFLETHPDPDHAPCDGPNMVPLAHLEELLWQLKRLDEVIKS
ncbi:MAG: 3-deoxy-8-phosphooctulonate synthase [Magnetococcus sp. DMHC-6]